MERKILYEDLSWSGWLLKLLVNIFNITSEQLLSKDLSEYYRLV